MMNPLGVGESLIDKKKISANLQMASTVNIQHNEKDIFIYKYSKNTVSGMQQVFNQIIQYAD